MNHAMMLCYDSCYDVMLCHHVMMHVMSSCYDVMIGFML